MSEPLKGKGLVFSNPDIEPIFAKKDIRSAVEWFMILEQLITDAMVDMNITEDEYDYWMEMLIYEEAFEDVMKE